MIAVSPIHILPSGLHVIPRSIPYPLWYVLSKILYLYDILSCDYLCFPASTTHRYPKNTLKTNPKRFRWQEAGHLERNPSCRRHQKKKMRWRNIPELTSTVRCTLICTQTKRRETCLGWVIEYNTVPVILVTRPSRDRRCLYVQSPWEMRVCAWVRRRRSYRNR